MKFLLLGTPQDVRGFALAGVEGRICASGAELKRALREGETSAALLALSTEVAALAPAAVRAFRGPLVILPETRP